MKLSSMIVLIVEFVEVSFGTFVVSYKEYSERD